MLKHLPNPALLGAFRYLELHKHNNCNNYVLLPSPFTHYSYVSNRSPFSRSWTCRICENPLYLDHTIALRCQHEFHTTCIKYMSGISRQCPVCGNDINVIDYMKIYCKSWLR